MANEEALRKQAITLHLQGKLMYKNVNDHLIHELP